MAKRRSDIGTLYRGSPGQWSWLFHRITGVAVILFLFAHVVDTAVVGWGPEAYNRVDRASTTTRSCGLLELGLVAAVLYHAFNGVKIMVIDFWPSTTPAHQADRARDHGAVRRRDDPDHLDHGQGDPGPRPRVEL